MTPLPLTIDQEIPSNSSNVIIMPNSSVANQSEGASPKPKLLFNLLVQDESSNDEYPEPGPSNRQMLEGGVRYSLDGGRLANILNLKTSFQSTIHRTSTNSNLVLSNSMEVDDNFQGVFFKNQSCDNICDMEQWSTMEDTRSKLKVLFSNKTTEPPITQNPGTLVRKSSSVPLSPLALDELGETKNSDGSIYRSLALKKRKSYELLSPSTSDPTTSGENIVKSKRLKVTDESYYRTLNHSYDKERSPKGSLLKKILCSRLENEEDDDGEGCSSGDNNINNDDDDEPSYSGTLQLLKERNALSHTQAQSTEVSTHYPSLSPSPVFDNNQTWSSIAPIVSSSLSVYNKKPIRLADSANESILLFLNRVVNFAYSSHDFTQLTPRDQRLMLISAMPKLLLLHMASENFHLEICPCDEIGETNNENDDDVQMTIKPTENFVESLRMFISRCQLSGVSKSEFFYLKLITLYRYNDPNKPLDDQDRVKTLFRESREELRDLTMEDRNRYANLLLFLYSVLAMNSQTLEFLFFQSLLQAEGVQAFVFNGLRALYNESMSGGVGLNGRGGDGSGHGERGAGAGQSGDGGGRSDGGCGNRTLSLSA